MSETPTCERNRTTLNLSKSRTLQTPYRPFKASNSIASSSLVGVGAREMRNSRGFEGLGLRNAYLPSLLDVWAHKWSLTLLVSTPAYWGKGFG